MVEDHISTEPTKIDVWNPDHDYDYRDLERLLEGDESIYEFTKRKLGCLVVYYHRLMRLIFEGALPTAWEKESDDLVRPHQLTLSHLQNRIPRQEIHTLKLLDDLLQASDSPRRYYLADEMPLRRKYRLLGLEPLLQRTDELAFKETRTNRIYIQAQSDIGVEGQRKLAHALNAALSPMILEVREYEMQRAILDQLYQILLRLHRVLALEDSGVIDLLPRERERFEQQLFETLDTVETVEREAEDALKDDYPDFFSSLLEELGCPDQSKLYERYTNKLGDAEVAGAWEALERVGGFYSLMTYSHPSALRRAEAKDRNYDSLTHHLGYFLSARKLHQEPTSDHQES